MINIDGFSKWQNQRYIADFIEPFIVKQLQKEHHTFHVYRCSDFNDIHHLISCHKFNIKGLMNFLPILENYWSSIDIIQFKIKELPVYFPNKAYFNILRSLATKEKNVIDIEVYEVKLTKKCKTAILSVKSYECARKLEGIGKRLKYIPVNVFGDISIYYKTRILDPEEFKIETHFGRKGYYVKPDAL